MHRAENFSFIWISFLFHMQCSGCNIEKLNFEQDENRKFCWRSQIRSCFFLLINNFFSVICRHFSRLISIFLLHKNEWNEKEQKSYLLHSDEKVRCDMSSAFLQLLLKGFFLSFSIRWDEMSYATWPYRMRILCVDAMNGKSNLF